VRRIQESFERSPRKSTRRASRELGIPQPTIWRVLRRRLRFNSVHRFESPCTINLLCLNILYLHYILMYFTIICLNILYIYCGLMYYTTYFAAISLFRSRLLTRATNIIQGVPLATESSISLIILLLMRILQRNLKRTYLIV